MTGKLPISVIIPVYNDPVRVRRAIASVIGQTVAVEEILIIDDGSPTPLKIDGYPGYSNLKVIRKTKNSGAAAARNFGILNSSGDYVAFLDADDMWYEEKLEQQFHYLLRIENQTDKPILCSCGFLQQGRYVANLSKPMRQLLPHPASSVREFVSGCWYAPGTTLLTRRSWIEQIGLFDEDLRRYEDYEYFLRWAVRGAKLVICPGVLAKISTSKKNLDESSDLSIGRIMELHGTYLASYDKGAARRFYAYLHLEKAAAAFNRKQYHKFLSNLIYSYVYKPRPTLQVSYLWKQLNDESCFKEDGASDA